MPWLHKPNHPQPIKSSHDLKQLWKQLDQNLNHKEAFEEIPFQDTFTVTPEIGPIVETASSKFLFQKVMWKNTSKKILHICTFDTQ